MTDLAAIIDGFFNGGTVPANLYVGLVSSNNFSAYSPTTDTMGSHAGWEEFEDYTEATRPVWTPGTTIDGSPASVSNPGMATFTPDANGTIVGIFLCDNSTIGGATGQLYGPWPLADGAQPAVIGIKFKATARISLRSNTPVS